MQDIKNALMQFPVRLEEIIRKAREQDDNQLFELIIAYCEGYNSFINSENILDSYNKLYTDLDEHEKENQCRIALYTSSAV